MRQIRSDSADVNGINRETMTSDREAHAYAHFSRQATGQCFRTLMFALVWGLVVALGIIKQERSATACLP